MELASFENDPDFWNVDFEIDEDEQPGFTQPTVKDLTKPKGQGFHLVFTRLISI
jgi:hypothetical protein